MTNQRGNIGAGIAALAIFLDKDGELIMPVEGRFLLSQRIFIQFQPFHPVIGSDFPRQGFSGEGGTIGEGEQHALLGNHIADTCFFRQFAMPSGGVEQERS